MNKFIFITALLIVSQYTQAKTTHHIEPLHRTFNEAVTKFDNEPNNEVTGKKFTSVLTTLSDITSVISASHARIAKIITEKIATLRLLTFDESDVEKDVTKVESSIREAITEGSQKHNDLFKSIHSILSHVVSLEELKEKVKKIQYVATNMYTKAIAESQSRKGFAGLQKSYSTFIRTLTTGTEKKLRTYMK